MKLIEKFFLVLIVFVLVFCISVRVQADDHIKPSDYKVSMGNKEYNEGSKFFKKVEVILTIIRGISIIVALISITIVGLKYIVGSVEEKAQYKEKLIPIAIGAVLIAGISTFLTAIEDIMN